MFKKYFHTVTQYLLHQEIRIMSYYLPHRYFHRPRLLITRGPALRRSSTWLTQCPFRGRSGTFLKTSKQALTVYIGIFLIILTLYWSLNKRFHLLCYSCQHFFSDHGSPYQYKNHFRDQFLFPY